MDWRRQKDDEFTWNTWALELPVLARYNVLPQMYFEAGPRFALLLSSEMEQDLGSVVETTNFGKNDALNIFEFGIDVGIGCSVMSAYTKNTDPKWGGVFLLQHYCL